MDKVHPLQFTDFLKYRGTKYEKYILPIIPVGVELTDLSNISPKLLGKIPGRMHDDGKWAGFHGWEKHYQRPSPLWLPRWMSWQIERGIAIPLGFNSTRLNGFDFDITDPILAAFWRERIEQLFGKTPLVRRRDGSDRFMMCYLRDERTAPYTKLRVVCTRKDGETDGKQMLEILPENCQWVAEGPHASGAMHYWENEAEAHKLWDDIPLINGDMALKLWGELREMCPELGYELVTTGGGGIHGGDRAAAVSITSLTSPHIEANRDRLTRAIQHIDLDHSEMDYDAFINLQRAICAAVMGDRGYMAEVVWPWCCTQKHARGNGPRTEEQGIEWLEARWDSFSDSCLGADHVYWWADKCGYSDAWREANGEKAEGLFDAITDDNGSSDQGAAGSAAQAGGAPNAGGAGGGTGSNGPVSFRDTAVPIAKDLVPILAPNWRYSPGARDWLHFETARWVSAGASGPFSDIVEFTQLLAATLRATNPPAQNAEARARVLESRWLNRAVQGNLEDERMTMHIAEGAFDAQPYLLNTPGGVLNIETGALLPHAAEHLMRHMTRCTPNYELWLRYELGKIPWADVMPMFTSLLLNVAKDPNTGEHRPWVIDAIKLEFGQALIGEVRHQSMLFVQGLPGIGKTQIFEVLFKILGTYAARLLPSTLSKNGDGHRFDLVKLSGKRFYFLDETQLGMTWDETRGCLLITGDEIETDVKNGKQIHFKNRGSLIVVGNHRPHFVAHEAGGLSSRLMLLEAGGKVYRNTAEDLGAGLAGLIAEREGEAVMMWALEGAMADLADANGGWAQWRATMAPLRAAAQAYTRENSPVVNWVEDRQMVLRGDVSIDTLLAFQMYQAYMRETHPRVPVRTLSDFKQALRAAFSSIELSHRTDRDRKGRSCLIGLGGPEENFDAVSASDNVVSMVRKLTVKE
jgi:P4 family phage/plasmid primase-like protien